MPAEPVLPCRLCGWRSMYNAVFLHSFHVFCETANQLPFFNTQTSCLWLASCPAGSKSASKFGLVIFVLVLIVGICIVFWIHKRFQRVRTHHLEKRLRWIHNHNENHDNPLVDGDDGDDTECSKETQKTNDGGQIIQIDSPWSDGTPSSSAAANATTPRRPVLARKLTRITQTFDIEFEHLGLTLSNGTSILQVMTTDRFGHDTMDT